MRTALVTGANRGIGYEAARQMGVAGLRVVAAARDPEAGAAASNRLRGDGLTDVSSIQLDAASDESVRAAAAAATRLGRHRHGRPERAAHAGGGRRDDRLARDPRRHGPTSDGLSDL